MSQKLMLCLLVLVVVVAVAHAQWGGYYGGGGFDPIVGGPNRQWRRYYRCLNTGFCPYDYNTGHYYGRREMIRNLGGSW